MDPVSRISGNVPGFFGPKKGSASPGGDSFADTLKAFARYVDGEIKKSDRMAQEFAVGKRQDIHEVMIAAQKADLSFRFLLQIRNKLMEAYQEVMRMQF
ncbi:MAG: flagellar hook-basal body complex protein FliE [Deltaproteobacteria bacterium]|nr:flagellar hook-basal body complex protein FliE [Deltaproteobacteria bacterium]MBW2015405.1 flagellar hook-basal body complex protein FliE [Deltaproteobacteria bacterium]MBW2129554.1 flagellar hook-basal body complex protein FliE [Deltaproteobacteria bacterium]MBW2302774.1 flagellar hook-basal body complex protein FliE [Deltaproteobacteria bacterium]